MRHSKHLTLLVSFILAILVVGIMGYIYLTYYPTLISTDDNVDTTPTEAPVDQTVQNEAEIIQRLQAVSPTTQTDEEIADIKERLLTVATTTQRTPEEQTEVINRLQNN